MGVAAMKAGAHAFIETPIATTLEEMWALVNTSEETGRHCMHMENVCYGREELLYLNMVRQGLIGELLHGEAAYIHDLRDQMKQVERGTGSWRTYHYIRRNGNLYPCHGLGPVAQYMSLARTEDNFGRIVSFSSPSRARALYAKANFPPDHKWNKSTYRAGDINTSIVTTALGRTIMVQWDETVAAPLLAPQPDPGHQGDARRLPEPARHRGRPGLKPVHEWTEGEEWEKFVAQYEHPLFKRAGELAKKMGGHGGMDFLMLYRIVECLRNGLPLDQNVYEGCFWSSIGPLSEKSVAADGAPQDVPGLHARQLEDHQAARNRGVGRGGRASSAVGLGAQPQMQTVARAGPRGQVPERAMPPFQRRLLALTVAALLAATAGALPRGQPSANFAATIARLSEPGGYFDSDNLISNEKSYLQVVPALREAGSNGGAYVGVGPDQNFSYIAQVRPSIAFIIDIRRDNLLLHLLFKALFQLSDDAGRLPQPARRAPGPRRHGCVEAGRHRTPRRARRRPPARSAGHRRAARARGRHDRRLRHPVVGRGGLPPSTASIGRSSNGVSC